MAGWGTFLGAIAAPVVKKALMGLGIGLVTYTGVSAALNAALSAAQGAWGSQVGVVSAFLAIAGANTAMSIIAGAYVARVALVAVGKIGKVT